MTITTIKHKYRPAFSAEEVEALATILLEAYLTDLKKPPYLDTKPSDSTRAYSPKMQLLHYSLVGKINLLRAKIANSAITPAYTTEPHSKDRIGMLESLGMPEEEIAIAVNAATKENLWALCYKKYIHDMASCTYAETEAAYEHMYLHNLLTDREVAIFEAKDMVKES